MKTCVHCGAVLKDENCSVCSECGCVLPVPTLENGETKELEGFRIIDDLTFSITLEEPFEAFLACMSMPGASILDEETTAAAKILPLTVT